MTSYKNQINNGQLVLSSAPVRITAKENIPSAYSSSLLLGSDEEGIPITPIERRTLNLLVRRYLLSRGYKQTTVAFAEEVEDQNLGIEYNLEESEAELNNILGQSAGGGKHPALSLLSLYRKRIAPLRAVVAKEEAKMGEQMASLRQELDSARLNLISTSEELDSTKSQLKALELELMEAKNAKQLQIDTSDSRTGVPQSGAGALPAPSGTTAVASVSAASVASPAHSTLAQSSQLLQAILEGVPIVAPQMPSKERVSLVPILVQAIIAEPVAANRKKLFQKMLTLNKRPSTAERTLIKIQLNVLASKLGPDITQEELLPAVQTLSIEGKTKERKALAAILLGSLSPYISEVRMKFVLSPLHILSESKHAIVRVAVIEGLTAVASHLSNLTYRRQASGNALGPEMKHNALLFNEMIETAMWKCLGISLDANVHSNAQQTQSSSSASIAMRDYDETLEREELAEAMEQASTPNTPLSYALFGNNALRDREIALAKAARNAETVYIGRDEVLCIPSSWSTIPASLSNATASQLVPVLFIWSYRLGILWSKTLPSILRFLSDVLGVQSNAIETKSFQTYHVRLVSTVLTILSAGSSIIRQCLIDEGYTVKFKDTTLYDQLAEQARQQGKEVPPHPVHDFIYELFDYANQASLSTFPIEKPLLVTVRGGVDTYPPGVDKDTYTRQLVPRNRRELDVLNAMLRGTAAVRRRPNKPINPATLAPGTMVWSTLKRGVQEDRDFGDAMVIVSWPALKYLITSFLPSLLKQAASIQSTSSVAASQVVSSYASFFSNFGNAFGATFTQYVTQPMLYRGLGLPLQIPLSVAQNATGTLGRTPSLSLLSQVLFGIPSLQGEATRAWKEAAKGIFTNPPNWVSTGPNGADWPYVLPELHWLGHTNDTLPLLCNRYQAVKDIYTKVKNTFGPLPPPNTDPTTPGVPQAAIQRLGGVWNAPNLLPLLGGAVLACPTLNQNPAYITSIFESFICKFATGVDNWKHVPSDVLNELCKIAVQTSNLQAELAASSTGTSLSANASKTGAIGENAADTSKTYVPPVAYSNAGSSSTPTVMGPVLTILITQTLPALALSTDPLVRQRVASVLSTLPTYLDAKHLQTHFLPLLRKLLQDHNAEVRVLATRTLGALYSSGSASDATIRSELHTDIDALLEMGPKQVILEVLRAFMRTIPSASAVLRDGYILDQLMMISERILTAEAKGEEAMVDIAKQIGLLDSQQQESAKAAMLSTRSAAIQEHLPWDNMVENDLQDIILGILNVYQAYRSVPMPTEVRQLIQENVSRLLSTKLVVSGTLNSYRSTLAFVFEEPEPIIRQSYPQSGADSNSTIVTTSLQSYLSTPAPNAAFDTRSRTGSADSHFSFSEGNYSNSGPSSVRPSNGTTTASLWADVGVTDTNSKSTLSAKRFGEALNSVTRKTAANVGNVTKAMTNAISSSTASSSTPSNSQRGRDMDAYVANNRQGPVGGQPPGPVMQSLDAFTSPAKPADASKGGRPAPEIATMSLSSFQLGGSSSAASTSGSHDVANASVPSTESGQNTPTTATGRRRSLFGSSSKDEPAASAPNTPSDGKASASRTLGSFNMLSRLPGRGKGSGGGADNATPAGGASGSSNSSGGGRPPLGGNSDKGTSGGGSAISRAGKATNNFMDKFGNTMKNFGMDDSI